MSRAYVDRAHGIAASAEFVDMGRLGHYMLHRAENWNRFALRSTLEIFDRAHAECRKECRAAEHR
jgi:hypothetical protein